MATENVITRRTDGNFIRCTYDSLDEMAEAAKQRECHGSQGARGGHSGHSWTLGVGFDAALEMARTGWSDQLDTALDLAEHAVSLCEREHESMMPVMHYDVTGDFVDIGRYLAGEPECMVDYPLEPVSKVGKVITICIGAFYSAGMEAEALVRRGQVITALCIALSRMGHNTEIWYDQACQGHSGKFHSSIRTLVKGVNDAIDPAKILFAFAHPATTRRLAFAIMDGFTPEFKSGLGVPAYYAMKDKVTRDLPEGTIYLEGVSTAETTNENVTDQLAGYLRELGLLAE